MPGEDIEAIFLPGFVDALEALGTAPALATLRALAPSARPIMRGARAAGDRLAASGARNPRGPQISAALVRPRRR